jgi:hypothetical protein
MCTFLVVDVDFVADQVRFPSIADPTRVQAGLKATINNPRVSDEAKESARERLEGFEGDGNNSSESTSMFLSPWIWCASCFDG